MVRNHTQNETPLDHRIVFKDRLPLAIHHSPDTDQLSSSELRANLELLRAFWMFNETLGEDLKEQTELHAHLERIELKLDMQASMLALLLGQTLSLPPVVPITLSADSLQCQTERQYPLQERVRLELYLLEDYPKPLRLLGHIDSSEADGQAYNTVIRLLEPPAAMMELLEKILFRAHRRDIAQLRQKKSSD